MIAHVLGLAESVRDFKPDGNVTIGCNDIYRYFETDYLFVVSALSPARANFVENARPKKLFSTMSRWSAHPCYEYIAHKMTPWKENRPNTLGEWIYYSNNTPFIQASWAFNQGFKEIVLWGCDFTDHPLLKDDAIIKTYFDFQGLKKAMKEKGVSMYLGSPGSVLDLPTRS
jgi:hypothetical protein